MKLINNELNLESTRGDTIAFGIEIAEIGQPLDTICFTCKSNWDDETFIFQKSLGNGIELDSVEGDTYYYKVRIAPDDTKNMELGKYYYDIQIGVNGDIFTISKGMLSLDYDVTNGGV